MNEKKKAPTAAAVLRFEEALARLETIVLELEEGKIPLADSLARYEEGTTLLKQCYQVLEQAERRIELLNRVDPAGNEESEPFDDQASSLEGKPRARARRGQRAADPDATLREDEIDGPGRLF